MANSKRITSDEFHRMCKYVEDNFSFYKKATRKEYDESLSKFLGRTVSPSQGSSIRRATGIKCKVVMPKRKVTLCGKTASLLELKGRVECLERKVRDLEDAYLSQGETLVVRK